MRRLTSLVIVVLAASGCSQADVENEAQEAGQTAIEASADDNESPDIPAIIARLDDDDHEVCKSAAWELAQIVDASISEALRK